MLGQLLLSLRITWQNFLAAKMRMLLTVLGIVVGIAAVMIVMSLGASAQNLILDQIRSLGANLIAVLPGYAKDNEPPAGEYGVTITTLTNDDLDAIRKERNVPNVTAAAGYVASSAMVKYKAVSRSYDYQGASAEITAVSDMPLSAGRFFTARENDTRARVVVLGSDVARDIFDTADPVGKTLSIKDKRFQVIGVLEPQGGSLVMNVDNVMYVPLLTAQKDLLGISYLHYIYLRAADDAHINQVKHDIDALLRSRHNVKDDEEGDYSIRSVDTALSMITNITNIMKYFLVAVAGISLLVGGIGVMNIMFIALSQRIREIGLRKALGARRRDIVAQFLFESMIIAVVGAICGFLAGLGVIFGIAGVAHMLGYAWHAVVTAQMALLALAIAVVLGVLFGSYPAYRAAHVSPMEALRYE